MITQHTKETILEGFVLGLKGIFNHSEFLKDPFKSRIISFSLIMGIILSVGIICLKFNLFSYINEIQSLLIQLIPGLLGFTIAGYSFLMGFIQPKLMDRISEPNGEDKMTLYQSISSSLALNILFHAFFLIVAYIIHLIILLQDKNPENSIIKSLIEYKCFVSLMNWIGTFLMNISLFCSLGVVIQIIVSSFNLSQLLHYDTNKAKLDAKSKVEEASQ